MRTEKKNTKNTSSVKVASSARNAQANLLAVEKLLDSADSQVLVSLLDDAIETYLVSDFYAWAEQTDRQTNYSLLKELSLCIKTLKSA